MGEGQTVGHRPTIVLMNLTKASLLMLAPMFVLGCSDASNTDSESEVIGDALGDYYSGESEEASQDIEAERAVFVADCMKQRGHDYVSQGAVPPIEQDLGLSDLEFAEQYGFGLVAAIDLQAARNQRVQEASEDWMAHMGSMSEAEQSEYLGAEIECQQEALIEFGPPESGNAYIPEELKDRMDSVVEQVNADPRLAETVSRWSSCMAEDGFRYANPEEMIQPFDEAYMQWSELYRQGAAELVADGANWQTLRITDVLSPEELDVVEALAADERTVAVADLACREAGNDVEKTINELQAEYMAEEFGS